MQTRCFESKIIQRDDISEVRNCLKNNRQKIVFTNGCFDLFHIGHLRTLQKAKGFGDQLIVGLNSDKSVRGIKGPTRPVYPELERAEILAGLECVDYVVLFDEPTPLELIQVLRPHVLVKGGGYSIESIIGANFVKACGGEVQVLPFSHQRSTTTTINTIKERPSS